MDLACRSRPSESARCQLAAGYCKRNPDRNPSIHSNPHTPPQPPPYPALASLPVLHSRFKSCYNFKFLLRLIYKSLGSSSCLRLCMYCLHLLASQVLCTMVYERASAAPLHHFAGVLVTGDHPVFYAGRWGHAADTPGARLAPEEDAKAAGPLLYDLVTSGKRIYTVGGGCFSDYDEVQTHFACTQ
jgi:hypothetical protein